MKLYKFLKYFDLCLMGMCGGLTLVTVIKQNYGYALWFTVLCAAYYWCYNISSKQLKKDK
jgi:hypothetical protein